MIFSFQNLNLSMIDREEFIAFRDDLMERISIWTMDDLRFHSSILTRLTRRLHHLSSKTSVRHRLMTTSSCSWICLDARLEEMFRDLFTIGNVSFEFLFRRSSFNRSRSPSMLYSNTDGQSSRCSSSTFLSLSRLQAINAPLRQRSSIRRFDLSEQKRMAKKIFKENRFLLSRLTSIFNIYLSANQRIELNGDFIRFSLEKLTSSSSDQLNPVLVRYITEPLAIFDDLSSLTNLSRSNSSFFEIQALIFLH